MLGNQEKPINFEFIFKFYIFLNDAIISSIYAWVKHANMFGKDTLLDLL